MEILMNLWLAFNIVFGFFTGRNIAVRFTAYFKNKGYNQSDLGRIIDRLVLVSIITHYFTIS